MEKTNRKDGDASTEFLPAALDGTGRRTGPLDATNGPRAVHRDVSSNKHGYWRGGGLWGRSPEPPDSLNRITDPNRTMIDTKAPFESVKDAVCMFGGNVEWKAQSALIKERSRHLEQELEKAEHELPLYQKEAEVAEEAKARVLRELEATKQQVEELRLQLQKARTEETQARQDSELAELRVKEIEQGVAEEHSVAAKAQVRVVNTRWLEADEELKSIEVELYALKKECDRLMGERDVATAKAEEAVMASNDAEKRVEELRIEHVVVNEVLESAQASHLKAEELRLNAAMEKEQESHEWKKRLKQSEEELHAFEEKLAVVNDLKSKLDTESALLSSLKLEHAACEETEMVGEEKRDSSQLDALTAAKNELEEVKSGIEKAKDEVNCLRIATSSLKSELEAETSRLFLLKQKQKISDLTISSLEAKLENSQSEQEEMQVKETESNEEMRVLPHELKEKTEKTYEAKSEAHFARKELIKAMEEADLAKASANTMEHRLQAVLKEIEASKASEKLAVEAIKAIQESEEAAEVISIPLEEYYALSKRAGGVERLLNEKLTAAVVQIKDAKRTELISRQRLEAAYKEMKERKEALKNATEKAEKATEGKLKMEQELRDWRAENEQRRKAGEAFPPYNGARCYWKSFDDSGDINGLNLAAVNLRVNSTPNPDRHYKASEEDGHLPELRLRRKRSFFPRIVMFLARKKVESLH